MTANKEPASTFPLTADENYEGAKQLKLRFVVRTINARANNYMIQVKYNKNNKKATNQRGLYGRKCAVGEAEEN